MGRIGYATGTAVCIGINEYPGTDANLSGCVNDAEVWGKILGGLSYEVCMRTDENATRDNILTTLRNTIGNAKPKDRVVITFSGHGTFVPDAAWGKDETDGADEAWCPHDVMTNGIILDDELATIFRSAAKGVRITMISDSCHSGTMARAMFRAAVMDTLQPKLKVRFLPPSVWARNWPIAFVRTTDTALTTNPPYFKPERVFKPAPVQIDGQSPALLLAGCQDNESSYDAYFYGKAHGAFTYYATKTLLSNRWLAPTYAKWMAEIRKALPSPQYPQTPQLYGTKTQTNWRVFA